MKKSKRKAEKRWKITKLTADWENFKDNKNALNSKLNQLKEDDLSGKIQKAKGNSKAMFKILNSSLNRNQELPLPHHTNSEELANNFNDFFEDKIKKIRGKRGSSSNNSNDDVATFIGSKLNCFKALSQSEIKILIKEMPVKHCNLDPLPTWLMLECLDEFLPIITRIVNLSLKLG